MHCEVASTAIVDGLQVTATDVIVEEVDCTVTVAVPDFVLSCVLVAVTVTVPGEAGAVKSPLASMLPPLADHVTPEPKAPVPTTDALHWDVAFIATAEGVQAAETDEIEDDMGGDCVGLEPPPQAVRVRITAITPTRRAWIGCACDLSRSGLFRLRGELLIRPCSLIG